MNNIQICEFAEPLKYLDKVILSQLWSVCNCKMHEFVSEDLNKLDKFIGWYEQEVQFHTAAHFNKCNEMRNLNGVITPEMLWFIHRSRLLLCKLSDFMVGHI